MRFRLFSASFIAACLLFFAPAYADVADDASAALENAVVSDVQLDDGIRLEEDSEARDDGAQGLRSSEGEGKGDVASSSNTSPLDTAPDTVAGNQATISKTETITQLVKVEKQDMYRLYNPNSGEHFYTASTAERSNLTGLGWIYEGVGWVAPVKSDCPVYRLYNPNAGDHHYTLGVGERDYLRGIGWRYEGIGWYSASSLEGKSVFRQYNPNAAAGSHNFTTDASENRMLVNAGWRAEGIGWYALVSDTKTVQTSKDRVIDTAPYLSATFTAADGCVPETIVSYAKKNETYLFLPSYAPLDSIYLSAYVSKDKMSNLLIAGNGAFVAVDSRSSLNLLSLGAACDANGALKLSFKTSGSGTVFPLIVMQSANISTIYVNSNDIDAQGRGFVEASPDHSAKANVVVRMVDSSGAITYDQDAFDNKKKLSTIKGRGNSTWSIGEKKPYQISLGTKADLVGNRVPAKKWILLANGADATLIHSSIAYDLAAEMGLATVGTRPVDLYYDGEYRGSYLLAEKVEINSGRVDINDLEEQIEEANKDIDLESLPRAKATNKYGNEFQYVEGAKDPTDITGGYLLELDVAYYSSEPCWFKAYWPGPGREVYFVLKSPEFASRNAVAYISEAVQEALDNIEADRFADGLALSNGTFAFDLDSFAKMYLLEEFLKNLDTYISSTYFYLDSASKVIYSGPVWDFDTSMGTRTDVPDSQQCTYWGYYFIEFSSYDEMLTGKLRDRIRSLYEGGFSSLVGNVVLGNASAVGPSGNLKSVDGYVREIEASQCMNEVAFGITSFPNEAVPFATWEKNIEYLRNWLTYRLEWFDDNLDWLAGKSFGPLGRETRFYNDFDYGYVFDYQYYLAQNPDLVAAGIRTAAQALEHFVTYGMCETSRIGKTSRNFNVKAYMENNPELKKSLGTDIAAYYRHYCTEGFKKSLVCW